jgi:hypothetical protein
MSSQYFLSSRFLYRPGFTTRAITHVLSSRARTLISRDGNLPTKGRHADWVRRNVVTTRECYEKLFINAGATTAVGEASPIYLIHPAASDRIRRALSDVRLIAILRHPVERARAAWSGLLRDGSAAALA